MRFLVETDRNDLTYHIYNLMEHIYYQLIQKYKRIYLKKGIYIIKSVSEKTQYVGRFIKN